MLAERSVAMSVGNASRKDKDAPHRSGASEATNRTRTGDLSFTKASLYQLSYGGDVRAGSREEFAEPPISFR